MPPKNLLTSVQKFQKFGMKKKKVKIYYETHIEFQ